MSHTTLCEQCFPGHGEQEILTIVPLTPCCECGRFDERRERKGLVCHLFRSDPRAVPLHNYRPERQAMKHKTSTLEGALLDAAVAKAAELRGELRDWDGKGLMIFQLHSSLLFRPHLDWSQGGPLIERERIELIPQDSVSSSAPTEKWFGAINCNGCPGPTALIAAMRTFVASKFGEEVELP